VHDIRERAHQLAAGKRGPHLLVGFRLELCVFADDDDVGIVRDVLLPVSFGKGNVRALEVVADGRIEALVRAADPNAHLLQEERRGAHAFPGDADKMRLPKIHRSPKPKRHSTEQPRDHATATLASTAARRPFARSIGPAPP
jgi:hypothetical protein